jgi:hypothetical protein
MYQDIQFVIHIDVIIISNSNFLRVDERKYQIQNIKLQTYFMPIGQNTIPAGENEYY